MQPVTTIGAVRARMRRAREAGHRIGLVPTMGALHAGHRSLVTHARRHAEVVVVSIFVNLTQFAAGEDFEGYPRDLDGDLQALAGMGEHAPEVVFAPTVAQMYPDGPPATTVHVAGLTDRLCGRARPGHFDGVATVVAKLHSIVTPDVAVYGRKDFQQLRVIQQLVHDLHQPVEVVGAPIVREPDGLAMSSRNAYLASADRAEARGLSRALRAGVRTARQARAEGRAPASEMIRDAVAATMEGYPRARIEYVEVVDAVTLAPPDAPRGQVAGPGPDALPASEAPLLAAVAVHLGAARLIDNVVIGDRDDEDRLLAATGG